LLAGPRFLPLVEVVERHKAAPAFERLAESRLALYALGLGINVGEADLDVLGPIRDQTPAQHVETALPGLGVVADDRQGVGGSDVPAWRKIRQQPLGRNAEDEPDFAYIGGKAGVPTHAAILAWSARRPKRAAVCEGGSKFFRTPAAGPIFPVRHGLFVGRSAFLLAELSVELIEEALPVGLAGSFAGQRARTLPTAPADPGLEVARGYVGAL